MEITWSSDSLSLYYIWLISDTEVSNTNPPPDRADESIV